jgi:hypothetical protein
MGTATGTIDCAAGVLVTDHWNETVTWDNGRSTTSEGVEHSRFLLGRSDGSALSGEFNGLPVTNLSLEGGADPRVCLENHASSLGFYAGRTTIGQPG